MAEQTKHQSEAANLGYISFVVSATDTLLTWQDRHKRFFQWPIANFVYKLN